jgi:16S rRNA (guanine527-N7)-methyltransferase
VSAGSTSDRGGPDAALVEGAAALGVSLPAGAVDQLGRYLAELQRWGAKMNLTGSLAGDRLVEHVLDSLAVALAVPSGSNVVDVGSGGGFPAIPLAIARPDVRITMVEATTRKCAFLRHAARLLSLAGCRVDEGRLEALRLGGFDVAVSRAAMAPARWLETGLTLVRPGGRVLLMLSSSAEAPPGGELLPYRLPGGVNRALGIHTLL